MRRQSPPRVLVVNSGSSSLKYAVVQPDSGTMVADGIVERIGDGPVADHGEALRVAFEQLAESGQPLDSLGLVAVGHRVVHGGPDFYQPTVIDDALVAKLKELAPLAELHNPPAVLGIEVARKALPGLPHIAVFDTAFFHDLPPAAASYAIDRDLARRWNIRRYGFHGTSHQYVSEQVATFLDDAAGIVEPDRPSPRQRGVCVRDCRRQTCRHLDGTDAAGGPGDGHALRRHRPGRHVVPLPHGGHGHRGHRRHAQRAIRRPRSQRRDRLPRHSQENRDG